MRLLLSLIALLFLLLNSARAFSLIGPFQDWMQPTNGFRKYGEIGGPMNISEEYRWNVPVLTYAFDQSFLDYFGSNGVAAVENAIQILNNLPAANSIILENFPLEPRAMNFTAHQQNLYDLKSVTLSLLIEQLGLASPTRHVFILRRWHPFFGQYHESLFWPPDLFPYYVDQRNFDPLSLAPSTYVNETLLYGIASDDGYLKDVWENFVDPLSPMFTAAADRVLEIGQYFSTLSRDDVGGMRYLLATNNINFETLLPDVRGVGTNANSFVNGAWRPGVNKITFLRQEFDDLLGQSIPITNRFVDTYITNGIPIQQQLERVITQPDFLFSVTDHDQDHSAGGPLVERTSASNWFNYAALNGDPTKGGPGVIRPPVKFAYYRFGLLAWVDDYPSDGKTSFSKTGWGAFDGSTNVPVVFPAGIPSAGDSLNVALSVRPANRFAKWKMPVSIGGTARLEISTNLTTWRSVATVTNQGHEVLWYDGRVRTQQYYRVVPE